MATQRIKHTDVVKIGDVLRAHCIGEAGRAIYEDNWNDARVAEVAGVGVHSVAYMRQAMMGRLTAPRAITLEARIAALEAWAAARPVEPFGC